MDSAPSVVIEQHSVSVVVPNKQLLDGSLRLICDNKQFDSWSERDHADSHFLMRRIAQIWKNSHFSDQYLIYGKIDSDPFNWEIVPYQKCHTSIGRVVQQLQVLWRTIFGGFAISEENRQNQAKKYKLLWKELPEETSPLDLPSKGDDAFCNEETIKRQTVFEGKKVRVLFNYAPIGFGGEKLHFLIVPKEHRENFTDITQDEYCESLDLTQQLFTHFKNNRSNIQNVYLLNKTGIDAGQTVKHWHLHVIFSTNAAQDFWGKVTIVKNILLGSSPMKKNELAEKVNKLKEELTVFEQKSSKLIPTMKSRTTHDGVEKSGQT